MSAGRAPEIGQGGRIRTPSEIEADRPRVRGPRLDTPEMILADSQRKEEEMVQMDPRFESLEFLPDEELVSLADVNNVDCGELLDIQGNLVDRKVLLQMLVDAGVGYDS